MYVQPFVKQLISKKYDKTKVWKKLVYELYYFFILLSTILKNVLILIKCLVIKEFVLFIFHEKHIILSIL